MNIQSMDIEEILEAGDDIAREELRAFSKGIENNDANIVGTMIREGFSVNTLLDAHNNTGIHKAARIGLFDMVELLLDNDADVEQRNALGNSALMETINGHENTRVEIVCLIAAKLATRVPNPIRLNDFRLVNIHGETLLMNACVRGSTQMIQLLIDHGFDPSQIDRRFGNSLHHLSMRRLSSHEYFDVSSALSMLIEAVPHTRLVDMEGFGGITALHVASMKQSSTVMVKLLLAHGANVSHVNSIGQTPLHIAAQHAVHPTVKLLCEAGSDVQAKDNKGRVPIHMAFGATKAGFRKHLEDAMEIVTILIDFIDGMPTSGYLNAKDCNYMTPLHFICEHAITYRHDNLASYTHALGYLLNFPRFDINARNIDGDTALHVCARNGLGDIGYQTMNVLLRHGVLINLKNIKNETAQDIMETRRSSDIWCSAMADMLKHRHTDAQECSIPFAMGHHDNLNHRSVVKHIPPEMLKKILGLV